MSRYTVVWVQGAEDELMELWMAAEDRRALTAAAWQVDRLLGARAADLGEPLAEGLRSLNVPPLRVLFAVNEQDRIVEVARVRAI